MPIAEGKINGGKWTFIKLWGLILEPVKTFVVYGTMSNNDLTENLSYWVLGYSIYQEL